MMNSFAVGCRVLMFDASNTLVASINIRKPPQSSTATDCIDIPGYGNFVIFGYDLDLNGIWSTTRSYTGMINLNSKNYKQDIYQ